MSASITHQNATPGPGNKVDAADWTATHTVTGVVVGGEIALSTGTLTGSVTVPSGAWLVGFEVDPTTLWDGGATMDLGDGGAADGFLSALDLTAADIPFSMSAAEVLYNLSSGGAVADAFNAASYVATEGNGVYVYSKRRYPSGGTITATVTATSPTVGATRVLVLCIAP